MIGVTADTNIYISALEFGGQPLEILDAARRGLIRLDISPPLLDEIHRVLQNKFCWSDESLQRLALRLSRFTSLVRPASVINAIPEDPDDNRVLECAVEAGPYSSSLAMPPCSDSASMEAFQSCESPTSSSSCDAKTRCFGIAPYSLPLCFAAPRPTGRPVVYAGSRIASALIGRWAVEKGRPQTSSLRAADIRAPDYGGEFAVQYMLAIYGDERTAESTPREQTSEIINAYMAYTKALQDAKVLVGSNRLRPTSAATTVRTVDGQTKVLDGPFAETKEQLGGYYLIDVPDLDAALVWAKRCPAARYGTVEVRPVWVM